MIPNLIVPTLRRYDLLARLMDSLDFPIAHMLVVDNGGELRDLRKPDVVERLTVLSMPNNLGVAGSWNLGVKAFPFCDRWFVCSDDVQFSPGGLETWFAQSSPDDVAVSAEWPHWQFFTVGENALSAVGLFDENYFPANFEDDDFGWRCEVAGVPVRRVDVDHSHTKQGTVHWEHFAGENARTYPLNEAYYKDKRHGDDVSAGVWSLERRRVQEWRR